MYAHGDAYQSRVLLGVFNSSSLHLTGVISGTGGLNNATDGNLFLDGSSANTYAGITRVTFGVASRQHQQLRTLPSVPHGLVVNANAKAIYHNNNQIVDNFAVTVAGTLDLNGFSDRIGALTLNRGFVTTGAGLLTMAGNITSVAAATASTINGNLDLGGVARVFTVGNGVADPDLQINAVVSNGAIVKAGAGKMVLAGKNTYLGQTTVSIGTLNLRNSQALGSNTGGTVVADGPTLQLEGGIDVLSDTLQLTGAAKLDNFSGNNRWAQDITLIATAANPNVNIVVGGNSLALDGKIEGSAGLTKLGSGNLLFGALRQHVRWRHTRQRQPARARQSANITAIRTTWYRRRSGARRSTRSLG